MGTSSSDSRSSCSQSRRHGRQADSHGHAGHHGCGGHGCARVGRVRLDEQITDGASGGHCNRQDCRTHGEHIRVLSYGCRDRILIRIRHYHCPHCPCPGYEHQTQEFGTGQCDNIEPLASLLSSRVTPIRAKITSANGLDIATLTCGDIQAVCRHLFGVRTAASFSRQSILAASE